MSFDPRPLEHWQEIVDEVLRSRDLTDAERLAVRDVIQAVFSSQKTVARERGSLLTIPYESQAEPTLAPPPDPSTTDEYAQPSHPPRGRAPESDLVAVGLLGQGGMGEVHRAQDNTLGRDLAMKLLHGRLSNDPRMRARFLAEAAVTAQLAHPGIPPVHQLGESDSGRPFFTMKEVHGRTLGDVIRDFHRPGPNDDWTEPRLLRLFSRVCEAVAYAHSRGVIHCDLKPANIMVGAFGEVLVMDWGVARLVDPASGLTTTEGPVTHPWQQASQTDNTVAGTPAYMSPEQASGSTDEMGPHSDVFSLGVILYEILAGKRPFRGDIMRMMRQIVKRAIPPIERRAGTLVDDALERIIRKALAADPADRYPDAGALGEAFGHWAEGSLKREAALKVVREAEAVLPDIRPRREQARSLREIAEQRLAALDAAAEIEQKASAWALLDEAEGLDLEVAIRMTEMAQLLQGALAHAPDLPEARKLLARIDFDNHQRALARRDRAAAVRHEMLLREHDVGDYVDYLAGTSSLNLRTEPPCEVVLHRQVEQDRRLVAVEVRSLGTTPLVDVELPIGSYLLELRAEGRPAVFYPVRLDRLESWLPAPPGATEQGTLHIPDEGDLTAEEAFVPGGWTRLGGDPDAPGSPREIRAWVPSIAMRRHPVTARELYRFLAESGTASARSDLLRATSGLWHPRWPAVGVTWDVARAYAAWFSEKTGQTWRLPTEAEWEKAARGVDGRRFPWGDFGDEAFCHARAGRVLPTLPNPVGTIGHDRSPYGIYGLAGNVRDWCLDAYRAGELASVVDRRAIVPEDAGDEPLRTVRGGSWRLPLELARTAARSGLQASEGHADVGFRLVREL